MPRRRIVFLTGTRADFGKLKPLMLAVQNSPDFESHVFVTGMHMVRKYGHTVREVEKAGLRHIYTYINHNECDSQDAILAKTIAGFSDYVKEIDPHMIVVHGDRPEALAGAIVGCFNNYLVSHIEGGEVSGTIDELIRHAVSKLSHLHFVANDEARERLRQMGERGSNIFTIGSPDVDVMMSDSLPSLEEVLARYEIAFEEKDYAIALFHPVTTERDSIARQTRVLVDSLVSSGRNYIVIYPNNDPGSSEIIDAYKPLQGRPRFRVLASMRFEYFLTLLKNARFIIGNSSAGVREAPCYGVPSVNLGSRQFNRANLASILHTALDSNDIRRAIHVALQMNPNPMTAFGNGDSCRRFMDIIRDEGFWNTERQKFFVDRAILPILAVARSQES